MKKSSEMRGLPIITIADGSEIGMVKSLVINPEKGSVDFLTIEHEDWQVSVKAIPFKKVIGIGEYAVTVENENAVIDLNEIPIANQLVNKKIRIIDTKVMTRKGQLIGLVTEYIVDDETGNIAAMVLKVKEQEVYLAAQQVMTFGKDIIIVNEDASNYFADSFENLFTQATAGEELLEEVSAPASNKDFEDIRSKQAELLKGKRVTKDIYNAKGDILISKGTLLEGIHISSAQEAGPAVFVELTMNVEE